MAYTLTPSYGKQAVPVFKITKVGASDWCDCIWWFAHEIAVHTVHTPCESDQASLCLCVTWIYVSSFQRPPTLTTSAALVVESDETVDDGLDILQHAFLPGMCVLLVSNIDIIFLLFLFLLLILYIFLSCFCQPGWAEAFDCRYGGADHAVGRHWWIMADWVRP